MAANRAAQAQPPEAKPGEKRLLWNPENVKDVAESVGIGSLGDEALRTLSQDVEYRIGQVIVEALRFMRAAKRTTMTIQDVSQAMKVLDVEPLYGYDSTRPLRYGEASLGPGQPLFYLEDEEVEFEKMINAPLPKVPRDANFTAHWLAVEGVQPSIPQNPTSSESRSSDLLPKGPGANPTLGALAGQEHGNFRPQVKHVLSKELALYFEKVQAALMDDSKDPDVQQFRQSALEAVSTDPGIHQLVPYFVNFISHQVTQCLDDIFVLRQMMELTHALIQNEHLFLEPYASPLCAPVITCLMGRKLGSDSNSNGGSNSAIKDQYALRELAASLAGQLARKYSASNKHLRPKLVRSCLKHFLDPMMPAAVWYGAVLGIHAAGGAEAVRVIVLPNLKDFENAMLGPLKEKGDAVRIDFETLVGGILKAVSSLAEEDQQGGFSMSSITMTNGVNGEASEREVSELKGFVGDIIGERIARMGNHRLVQAVLEAKSFL